MSDDFKPSRVEILKKERKLDAFFKVDEITASHERFNRSMSEPRPYLVFERGDAVAALLYDPERRRVIAVNQFRVPTLEKGQGQGWIVEAVAGMIRPPREGKPPETPIECIRREVLEETGYELTTVDPVSTFFSSPGGTSERIFLFFAEVRKTAKKEKGGGVEEDGEDIQTVEYEVNDFFRRLAADEFEDPKLIIAGLWFKARRGRMLAEFGDDKSRTFEFKEPGGGERFIGIKTGNISAIKSVPVWVNPENVYMMMDRFFGRSISATIRKLGAKKSVDGGTIMEDTIGKALLAELGNRSVVHEGTVVQTVPGELKKTHGVQRIFHVATVTGHIGPSAGLSTTLPIIQKSIDNVLRAVSEERKYRSVLIPLFGAGEGGFPPEDVAPMLIKQTVAFLKENPRGPLKEIYFLAYTEGDLEVLTTAIKDAGFVPFTQYDEPAAKKS